MVRIRLPPAVSQRTIGSRNTRSSSHSNFTFFGRSRGIGAEVQGGVRHRLRRWAARLGSRRAQGRRCRVAVSNCPLHLGGAPDGIDDARKLRPHPVAGVFHDPAACSSIFGSTSSRRWAWSRSCVPLAHQPQVTGYIGGKDRGEAAGLGHDRVGPWSKLVTGCARLLSPQATDG
jgi:hypothetical protein